MNPTYRHGGTGRDPLGPRHLPGMIANVVLGLLLIPLGLYAGLRHGGWAWLLLLIGALLISAQVLELYLDPIGGPRRRLHIRRRLWGRLRRRR